MESSCLFISFLKPAPTDIIVITEEIPIMIPSMVSRERPLFALIFCNACIKDAVRRIRNILGRKNRCAAVVAVDHRAGNYFRLHFWHKRSLPFSSFYPELVFYSSRFPENGQPLRNTPARFFKKSQGFTICFLFFLQNMLY